MWRIGGQQLIRRKSPVGKGSFKTIRRSIQRFPDISTTNIRGISLNFFHLVSPRILSAVLSLAIFSILATQLGRDGFAKFQTNLNNIAICNNGTYHINITLPTEINKDGKIIHPERFQQVHSNAIRAIQWIEPFLVALYGSPDILHMLNKDYSGGSLRLMLSRYIGLGTYNEIKMEKGKMLNDFNYKNKNHYLEKLHEKSPYILPETTGYDINYNKFLKHGIELRIFDYFPEEYLEDILNFIILVCAHSSFNKIPDPKENKLWQNFVIDVLKYGSNAMVSHELNDLVKTVFDTFTPNIFHFLQNKKPRTVLHFLNKLGGKLYKMYHDFSICAKLSPNMKPIIFVDYNNKIKEEFKKSINIV